MRRTPGSSTATPSRCGRWGGSTKPCSSIGARFALARALRLAGREKQRARELALRARETWAALAQRYGGAFVAQRDEADRWLASP